MVRFGVLCSSVANIFFYALLANVGAVIVLYGCFLCCLNLLCCYLSPWQFIRSR